MDTTIALSTRRTRGRGTDAAPRWAAAAIGAALAVLGCRANEPGDRAEAAPRPDVVLVVIDTLRADALGALGGTHPTPALDRLAAESFVFETAIAPSTWTLPSVASLMTSLHPSEHGLLGGGQPAAADDEDTRMPQVLGEERVTLAEAFQAGGYTTVGIVNQVYLRWKFGFGQGFDHYEGLRGHDGFKINQRLDETLDTILPAGAGKEASGGAGAARGEDDAGAGSVSTGQSPLFVYLHYLDPHWPYDYRVEDTPPPELAAADDETGLPRLPDLAAQWIAEQGEEALRRRALESLEARYALEVLWVDRAIENLIDMLERRGRWADTVLVITSDHGEGFWEHERLLHGHAPYEEQIRVPLLVRVPPRLGLGDGRRAAPVGLIDVMPTLLDLAGLPRPEPARGRSLVASMRGAEDADRAILVETGRERALRTRDAKVLVRRGPDAGTVEAVEYYDLAADPAETRNLATPCEGPCRDGVRRLREAERELRASEASAGADGVTVDEIEELRSLGYLGEGS